MSPKLGITNANVSSSPGFPHVLVQSSSEQKFLAWQCNVVAPVAVGTRRPKGLLPSVSKKSLYSTDTLRLLLTIFFVVQDMVQVRPGTLAPVAFLLHSPLTCFPPWDRSCCRTSTCQTFPQSSALPCIAQLPCPYRQPCTYRQW